ncbi:MAG: hypothetical protein Fur0018_06090 [Anaerolineales bacterium]
MPATAPRKILIVSSHALFSEGLRQLLKRHDRHPVQVIGIVENFDQAAPVIARHAPDLIVVDYDDAQVNQQEFIRQFIESNQQHRLVLLSLQEGGDLGMVYERRQIHPSQVDSWLESWFEPQTSHAPESPFHPAEEHRSNDMKHWIGVILLIVVLTALGIVGLQNQWLLTTPASAQAAAVDTLFRYEWVLISFLFALVVGFMLYSMIFFRRQKGDESDAEYIEGNDALEITWTILPLITVLAFAAIGARTLKDITRVQPGEMEIKVTGQQWSWRFEYPDGTVSDQLVLPVDQPVLLTLESVDVLHSFWVPEFRVKQDVVPGFKQELRITPTRMGDYKVRCAEICGQRHAYMLADVHVISQAAYEAWLQAQAGGAGGEDPAARGQQLAQQYGCLGCHSVDGNPGVGPTWKGLFGEDVKLADGSDVDADEAYLHESIVDPGAKIVEGFTNVMPPTFGDQLSEDQISDIIAFIQSLK